VMQLDEFVGNVEAFAKGFVAGRQEDAHEFTRVVLDSMVRGGCGGAGKGSRVSGDVVDSKVHQIFGGCMQSRVLCESCGKVSTTHDPFLDISLDLVRGKGDIAGALSSYVSPERLDGHNKYHCSFCDALTDASKQMSIRRAPNVLTLHLKRFDRLRKDPRVVRFPERLAIGQYMVGKPDSVEPRYRLSAVLVHRGRTQHSGHYIAYVRGSNDKWYLKDDAVTRSESLETVLSQEAYMLFYTRSVDDKDLLVDPWMSSSPTSLPGTDAIALSPVDDFQGTPDFSLSDADNVSLSSTAHPPRQAEEDATETFGEEPYSQLRVPGNKRLRSFPDALLPAGLQHIAPRVGVSFKSKRVRGRASSAARPLKRIESAPATHTK